MYNFTLTPVTSLRTNMPTRKTRHNSVPQAVMLVINALLVLLTTTALSQNRPEQIKSVRIGKLGDTDGFSEYHWLDNHKVLVASYLGSGRQDPLPAGTPIQSVTMLVVDQEGKRKMESVPLPALADSYVKQVIGNGRTSSIVGIAPSPDGQDLVVRKCAFSDGPMHGTCCPLDGSTTTQIDKGWWSRDLLSLVARWAVIAVIHMQRQRCNSFSVLLSSIPF